MAEQIQSSFRNFWAWLNSKTIGPWVLMVLAGVYGFARWETAVAAHGVELQQFKSETEARITTLKADFREDIVVRLEGIKESQEHLHAEQKELNEVVHKTQADMDTVKDKVRDISVEVQRLNRPHYNR